MNVEMRRWVFAGVNINPQTFDLINPLADEDKLALKDAEASIEKMLKCGREVVKGIGCPNLSLSMLLHRQGLHNWDHIITPEL